MIKKEKRKENHRHVSRRKRRKSFGKEKVTRQRSLRGGGGIWKSATMKEEVARPETPLHGGNLKGQEGGRSF